VEVVDFGFRPASLIRFIRQFTSLNFVLQFLSSCPVSAGIAASRRVV
jgi:hypothetical protein